MPEKQINALELIGSILVSKEIIIAILGGIMGAVLAPWTKWHFRKKELIREDRKERILLWREELGKFDTISNFHTNHVYLELVTHIPTIEKNAILSNDATNVIVFGDSTGVTDTSDRIITRLYNVISDIEKKCELI